MIQIGFGKQDITPPIGALYYGKTGDSISRVESVQSRLYARVLYFQQGDTTCALAMADVCGFTADEDERMQRAMADALGLPFENVHVNASHSHTTPHTFLGVEKILSEFGIPFADPEWVAAIEKAFIQAAVEAKASAVPAKGFAGAARVDRVASNRTVHMPDGSVKIRFSYTKEKELHDAPEGFIDSDVAVIQFRSTTDEPVVTIFNYSCHMAALATRGTDVSSDISGLVSERLEEAGAGPVFFLQGAGGNTAPGKYADGSLENVQALALRLEEAVKQALQNLSPCTSLNLTFRCWTEQVALNTDLPDEKDVLAMIKEKTEQGIRDMRLWKEASLLEVVRNKEKARCCRLFLLKTDDWCIAGLPAESFVEAGLAIKQASPCPHTLVGAYYNCTLWYIPTRKALRYDGYEAAGGWNYTAPGASEQLTLSVIRELANG